MTSKADSRMGATAVCSWQRFTSAVAIALVSLGTLGCNSSNTQLAGGTVTVDGKPVTMGKVMFYPVGGGRTGSGRIQQDGSFILSYRQPGDGVPVGEYKVTIIADLWREHKQRAAKPKPGDTEPNEEPQDPDEMEFQGVAGTLVHVVPPKYNALRTTPLAVTVSESGEQQQFTFDISSKD